MAKIWHLGDFAESEETQAKDGGGEELRGILEALLLVSGEPLSVETVAGICEVSEAEVRAALDELQQEYRRQERGFQLREIAGGYRLHTHPAYAEHVERLAMKGRRNRLTRAAIETLAIVAYLQPITRAQIANLRGVQGESLVKMLEELGLVRETGKENAPGGPALYGTTGAFLERFGLNALDELPPLEDFEPDEETVERITRSLSAGGAPESEAGAEQEVLDLPEPD